MESSETQDFVNALAVAPASASDPQTAVWFAARLTGLYRSLDGGQSWQGAYGGLAVEGPVATTAVVVSPDFASDRSVCAGVKGAILRSSDGGESWQVAGLGSPPPMVSSLVISPHFVEDGTLLAGTLEDGIFRSADRGRRWEPWNFGLLDLHVLALAISPAFARDECLFAGVETGIFRSTNGGRAWREVGFPIDCAPVISLAMSPNFAHDGVLFGGTEEHGLYRSDDRGRTWTRLGADAIHQAVNAILLSPRFPATPDALVLHGGELLVSRDGGQSWGAWEGDLPGEAAITAVLAPQGLERGARLILGLENGEVW